MINEFLLIYNKHIGQSLLFIMENYLIAAAVATLAPSLVIKGCTALVSGTLYVGNRLVYGKQKSVQQKLDERLEEMEKKFEERMLEISNRERNIDMKLDKLLKSNYFKDSNDSENTKDSKDTCDV